MKHNTVVGSNSNEMQIMSTRFISIVMAKKEFLLVLLYLEIQYLGRAVGCVVGVYNKQICEVRCTNCTG